ncbi:hypothetical protein K501DRAFT_255121 [Backusella circina FSU 941]|nr:hypothetical protein K501DRAFT_255121 [Backusella circina FSU 941]
MESNTGNDNHKAKLEHFIDQSSHAHSDTERIRLAEKASKLHEQATGHPMKIDEHGNIERESEEAKQCPALR